MVSSIAMKYCCKCKQTKKTDSFYPRSDRPGRYLSQCKSCRDLIRELPRCKIWHSKSYLSKHEENKAYRRNHVKNNLEQYRAGSYRYRASRKRATPPWLTNSQKAEMLGLKKAARGISLLFGLKMEIDHIVPLQGKNVSGLHVPWNLRIISSTQNKIKGRAL